MSSTLTIPSITMTTGAGAQSFTSSSAIPDTDTTITLTVSRTVAAGLNSGSSSQVMSITALQSNDGGTTWVELSACTVPGGSLVNNAQSAADTVSGFTTNLFPGTGRLMRATLQLTAGATVEVAGTLTTQ